MGDGELRSELTEVDYLTLSDTQQEAREWIRKIQGQVEQGLTYDDERITLGEFMEGWLENKKLQVRLATHEQYSWIAKNISHA